MATNEPETQVERTLRSDSDSLLEAVKEIRDLERAKRGQKLSSPEFHETAEVITDKSRRVFEIARDEEAVGNDLDPASGKTTEDLDG